MSPNEKKALREFLVFYRDGVANETPGMGSSRSCGLCNNAMRYDLARYRDKEHVKVKPLLTSLLERDFPNYMNNLCLPFNKQEKGMPGYTDEGMAKMCHVNPWRAAWVFKIIQELSREELPADS
jgi:hypothetical protein